MNINMNIGQMRMMAGQVKPHFLNILYRQKLSNDRKIGKAKFI